MHTTTGMKASKRSERGQTHRVIYYIIPAAVRIHSCIKTLRRVSGIIITISVETGPTVHRTCSAASPGIPGRLTVLFPREPGLISSPSTAGDYFLEAQGPWESIPEHLH